jgi:hypothetical protein
VCELSWVEAFHRYVGVSGKHSPHRCSQSSKPWRWLTKPASPFVCRHLDLGTDIALLVDAVKTKGTVSEGYQLIIDSIAGVMSM